jgi:glycosyltransferase involved in cell wall biosynthesis
MLYVASDQRVPGTTGGSTHVLEVARGLAARGHAVHAVVHSEPGLPLAETRDGVHFHRIRWSPDWRFTRFRARPSIEQLARELQPHVLIERYYNFGGEGILAALGLGVPSLLEVNSPILDYPGSPKAVLDRLLLFRPMRRWRERLVRAAAALVAPIPEIVPESAHERTTIVTWGANVEAFHPERRSESFRRRLGVAAGQRIVVFSGSFRPWHGVHVFERAARLLRRREDLYFLLVGSPDASSDASYRGRRLGRVAYERMPEVLASADIAVAPYDTSRMPELRLGFFWSPLKIFEAMAAGLAVVTIPRPPLTELLREDQEGLFFREGDAASLAQTLERLADQPALAERLGRAARQRVAARYSWARHCEQLEAVLRGIAA